MKLQDVVKKLPALAGALGIICLVAGLGTYLVTDDLDQRVLILLAFGAALLFATASYYPQELLAALRGRSARYGSNTFLVIVVFVAIVGMLNFLVAKRDQRWDLTENQDYSLSQQTISLLGKLEEPVKITAFVSQGQDGGREQIEDLLKEYRKHSDKIEYQFIDPELKPATAREYKIQNYGTTVVEYKGKREDVLGASEQDLTSKLLKLTRSKAVKVYFLTGHGESNIDGSERSDASALKAALEADNFEVAKLTLATAGSVPDDAGVLVIAGPKTPLLEDEKKAIKTYLENNGKALILLGALDSDSLGDVLEQWGVQLGKGVAIDPASSLSGQPQVPVVMNYGYSPITNDLVMAQQMTLLPLATAVTPSQQPPQGVVVSTLMATTDRAWLETDPKTARYDEGIDLKGPLSLAVSVEGRPTAVEAATGGGGQSSPANSGEEAPKTRMVVIGNNDFVGNDLVGEAALGNRDLFLNSVNWLSEQEDMISIRAKEPTNRMVFLSGTNVNFIFYTSVIFLPLAILAIGGLVWWNRR